MFKNIFSKNNNRGFTLIELLVVVSIIGVLSTIVLGSLNEARTRARDTARLAEVKSLQKALELYHLDNGEYPQIPSSGSLGFGFRYVDTCASATSSASFSSLTAELDDYITDLPVAEGSFPMCIFYITGSYTIPSASANCNGARPDAGYTIIFPSEATSFSNLEILDEGAYGIEARYCLFSA